MNILFTRFPLESANGGAENQTMWLAQGLKEKGHVVSFLGSCPVLSKRFSDAGFSSTQLNIGEPPVTKWGVISFFWRKKKMQRLLIERLEEFRIQNSEFCILMLSLSEKLLLTLWCKQQGIPVFWIEHDRIGSWLSKNPWLGALKKASQFATIICVSELSRKMYLDLGFSADRVNAIPNGIPVPAPHPPAPSPERGRGAMEKDENNFKKPINKNILKFARGMRKDPTPAEEILWEALRNREIGYKFRRQHPFQSRILDFYCDSARLGIELDGVIHDQPEQMKCDKEREEALNEWGIRILRFRNEEVLHSLSGVISKIIENLHTPLPPGEGVGVRVFTLGCVSRLSREKGVDVLIQSIATLPEVTLKIVGKGPDEGYVRTLIAEDTKRIGDERIHLQSNVENLSAFYESLDAFVLPSSDHDPFGLVAAEAMARGIPTIITSACGIASSLQPGEALIADAGSTESLNQNIQQMFDPTRRAALAEAGLNAVTSRLTLEQMVKSYEKLLSR